MIKTCGGATNGNICIFVAQWYSLLVNFSTAREGIVKISRYFEPFNVLVQIRVRVPICSRVGLEKSRFCLKVPFFFPYCNTIQRKVSMAKFWESKHCVKWNRLSLSLMLVLMLSIFRVGSHLPSASFQLLALPCLAQLALCAASPRFADRIPCLNWIQRKTLQVFPLRSSSWPWLALLNWHLAISLFLK